MGHIVHHAIIVTTWTGVGINSAHSAAIGIGCISSTPIQSGCNGYWTIIIAPDGSKSGWLESDAGDKRRDVFIDWLKSKRYDDGSSMYAWVEVAYGSDDRSAMVTRTEWGEV